MTSRSPQPSPPSPFRTVLKAAILFVLINLIFAATNPMPLLGGLTLYNRLYPGRVRLPFGEHPERAYNFSLYNLEAMFASHEISAGPKPADEFRIVVLGDSSVWGYLLRPEETLAAQMESCSCPTAGGKTVRVYNLGYPTISLLKDLVLLRYAQEYEPDLIVWLTTLEAFPWEKQMASPLMENNPQAVAETVPALKETLASQHGEDPLAQVWEQTVFGRRRELADLFRLQLYGFLWAATGVDQHYPETYDPPVRDLKSDSAYYGMQPPELDPEALAWILLEYGDALSGDTPILFVNEPVYISDGQNSDLRYNAFYPRWAYDRYRELFRATATANGWSYLDAWDAVPAREFTNSAIHFSTAGEGILVRRICTRLAELGNGGG